MINALILTAALLPAPDPVMDAVIKEATTNSQATKMLQFLSDKIGPRLTSSSNLEKGQKWAMGQFKKFGCTNVHLEAWGAFPVGFDRGNKCFGRMNGATPRTFEFTSPSWTEGTKGPLKGKAMKCPTTMQEVTARITDLKGAWVIMDRQPRRQRPGDTPTPEQLAQIELDKAVDQAGIAGRVYGARGELVLTSGNFRDKTFEKRPMDRSVTVRKSDMDEIMKAMDGGKPVELEFNLDQKFRKGGAVTQYNVIADIVGTEKPDEMVIISGHFDTWDGPGSRGTSDNGTGSCTTLETARLLLKAGAKPKRTIRFILWSGEEQGLFGSRGYVIRHQNEFDKISAVFVDDGGSNYCGGYSVHPTMMPLMNEAFAPVQAAFPDMPIKMSERQTASMGGGSDHASFNQVGVPGFFDSESGTEKYGTQDYNFIHHTQHDTMKYVIPMYLTQTSVAHASLAWTMANASTLLPRFPKPDYKLNPEGVPGLVDLLSTLK